MFTFNNFWIPFIVSIFVFSIFYFIFYVSKDAKKKLVIKPGMNRYINLSKKMESIPFLKTEKHFLILYFNFINSRRKKLYQLRIRIMQNAFVVNQWVIILRNYTIFILPTTIALLFCTQKREKTSAYL